ncbi:hypothetical protein ACJX0J_005703, partial [Zea mays]
YLASEYIFPTLEVISASPSANRASKGKFALTIPLNLLKEKEADAKHIADLEYALSEVAELEKELDEGIFPLGEMKKSLIFALEEARKAEELVFCPEGFVSHDREIVICTSSNLAKTIHAILVFFQGFELDINIYSGSVEHHIEVLGLTGGFGLRFWLVCFANQTSFGRFINIATLHTFLELWTKT